eukprot:scaffold39418_cov50-Phaeocystis_antarctica.AAC.1
MKKFYAILTMAIYLLWLLTMAILAMAVLTMKKFSGMVLAWHLVRVRVRVSVRVRVRVEVGDRVEVWDRVRLRVGVGVWVRVVGVARDGSEGHAREDEEPGEDEEVVHLPRLARLAVDLVEGRVRVRVRVRIGVKVRVRVRLRVRGRVSVRVRADLLLEEARARSVDGLAV